MAEAWRTWDEKELEDQYSPSRWSKRGSPTDVVAAFIRNGEKAFENVRHLLSSEDLPYGPSKGQKMHIFQRQDEKASLGAPIFVYIHGGFWQMGNKHQGCFSVQPLISATNCIYITVGYDFAPKATLYKIVHEVQMAAKQIIQLAKEKHSSGVYFAGHSAGAHLATMIATSDWLQLDEEAKNLIKGYICISGVYDLRPLLRTYVNKPMKMTDEQEVEMLSLTNLPHINPSNTFFCGKVLSQEDAVNNSPIYLTEKMAISKDCHFIITLGENEPPELLRQSQKLNEILQSLHVITSFTIIPNVDHYDIIENLCEDVFPLTQEIIRLIKSHE